MTATARRLGPLLALAVLSCAQERRSAVGRQSFDAHPAEPPRAWSAASEEEISGLPDRSQATDRFALPALATLPSGPLRGVVVARKRVFHAKAGKDAIVAELEPEQAPFEAVRLDFGVDNGIDALVPLRVGDRASVTRDCSRDERGSLSNDCVTVLRDAAGELLLMTALDQTRPFLPEHAVRIGPRDDSGCAAVAIGRRGSWAVFRSWEHGVRRWEADGAAWYVRANTCGRFGAVLVRIR